MARRLQGERRREATEGKTLLEIEEKMKQTATVELAGGKTLSLETGHLAKQAQGSCITRMGDNVVIGTACCAPDPREGIDFFPLTVDYREYTYAGGRIPGGF